jgi:hypothetical protein
MASCFVFAGAGCGSKDKMIKADGVLKWKDGSPIGGAMVEFRPVDEKLGKGAAGFTDNDGNFDLTTNNAGDGVLPGVYKVVVTIKKAPGGDQTGPPMGRDNKPDMAKAMKEWWEKQGKGQGGKPSEDKKSPIPEAYTKFETTPLKWTVESGMGKIELRVSKK